MQEGADLKEGFKVNCKPRKRTHRQMNIKRQMPGTENERGIQNSKSRQFKDHRETRREGKNS